MEAISIRNKEKEKVASMSHGSNLTVVHLRLQGKGNWIWLQQVRDEELTREAAHRPFVQASEPVDRARKRIFRMFS